MEDNEIRYNLMKDAFKVFIKELKQLNEDEVDEIIEYFYERAEKEFKNNFQKHA